jgi:hypothetical protein
MMSNCSLEFKLSSSWFVVGRIRAKVVYSGEICKAHNDSSSSSSCSTLNSRF